MTLSNFDWTDKASVRWFILLPTGHEGPYSLSALIQNKTSPDLKIWTEGLADSIFLREAIAKSHGSAPAEFFSDDELPPPLPPLPADVEEIENQIPSEDTKKEETPEASSKQRILFFSFIALVVIFWGAREWMQGLETFQFNRVQGMSTELHRRISQDFKFEGWKKKLFFKEYTPSDMSTIWLVTSGFQTCDVEASFQSLEGKLLIMEDQEVSFKTKGQLHRHLVEFSRFEFLKGTKIIPGLYEMDLKAINCEWDSFTAKLGNSFQNPEASYSTRMKVVLFHKGATEFNQVLDKLIQKKQEVLEKKKNEEQLFWQDLQQKLQTLVAISIQIEQLLIDFSQMPVPQFSQNLKRMVEKYTRNYGHFLTEFVKANEKYFQDLEKSGLKDMSHKRGYEALVRTATKNIGHESMTLIEELQKVKKPTPELMRETSKKVKKKFQSLKEGLNKRLIQLTEDRAQEKT
jgi:hypothetical protein